VRSGAPDPLDVMVTFNFANLAVELLKKRQWGRLVCLKGGRYSHEPLTILSQGLRRVPVKDYYDTEAYKPYLRSVLDMPMYMG
jgi:6-phosphofructokinase 1